MRQKIDDLDVFKMIDLTNQSKEIDEIANIYKRKILDFVLLCKNRIVVFDFDGAMTEFKYDKNRLLPCRDDDINEYFINNNFYEDCNTLKTIKYILNLLMQLGLDNLYVLTVSQPNVRIPKLNCIKKNFPMINPRNVLQVLSAEEKTLVLEGLYKIHKQEILFVEDTAKTLLNVEEKLDFVRGYHISSLIP